MLTINDVTRDVFTLDASAPAEAAAWQLGRCGFTGAPVVTCRHGQMAGIVTSADILRSVGDGASAGYSNFART